MGKNEELIARMTETRARNNTAWMGLLQLVVEYAPEEKWRPILSEIANRDKEVVNIFEQILR